MPTPSPATLRRLVPMRPPAPRARPAPTPPRRSLPVRPLPVRHVVSALIFAPGALAGCLLPQAAAAQPVYAPDLPVVEHTLDNGMRFLILPRSTSPTVSFVVHVPVGSTQERPGETGAAHLLEHLLFKGTSTIGTTDVHAERRLFTLMDAVHDSLRGLRAAPPPPPGDTVSLQIRRDEAARLTERIRALEDSARTYVVPAEFDEILSRNGARGLNASTSWESTEYTVELPANRAELWFVLEADRMRDPVFREFYREREVVEEERRARLESDPGGRLWETHMATAFQVHPYGVAPIGRMEDIRNLTRAQVEAFHHRHYGADHTVVAVVGDVDPDSVATWAQRWFGELEPRPTPLAPPSDERVEPEQTQVRRVEVLADAEPQLRLGWKVGGADDPGLAPLSMLANILVGGRDARLYRRLVRDEGMASFVSAGLTPGGRDPGLFTVQAAPLPPRTADEVEAVILDVLRELAEHPPTTLELDRVRNRIEAGRVRRLVSNPGLAQQLAASAATWGDWRVTFELQGRLLEVSAQEVSDAAARLLASSALTVAVLRRPPEGP